MEIISCVSAFYAWCVLSARRPSSRDDRREEELEALHSQREHLEAELARTRQDLLDNIKASDLLQEELYSAQTERDAERGRWGILVKDLTREMRKLRDAYSMLENEVEKERVLISELRKTNARLLRGVDVVEER